jgi:superfamily I DNA and/or RNA helicase
MLGGVADNDDDGAQAADVESILGLCRAQGLPERMLRWHYRSRHQSLIAVSNSQFYENKLFIVPSPYTSEAGVGLRFHHLPEAVYDRGKTASNPKEARAVALAVIEHAKSTPNQSLGVATFSTQQRRTIVDELELLRRQHPETEGFFSGRPDEPFFVKSLENIQGDERDVILISMGYGRDINGQVKMNFGPVSTEGGERRLNVLISRAK